MGNDPQKTKNKNVREAAPVSLPLCTPAYEAEIRFMSSADVAHEAKVIRKFLQSFRSDEDRGYLRIIDTDDAEEWYVKWKWTGGRWAGHYVFDRCIDGDIAASLRRLRSQVAEVRTGSRRPTKDKRYE